MSNPTGPLKVTVTDAETGEMRPHIPSPTLDAIRQRAAAATPGPWWAWDRGVGCEIAVGVQPDADGRPDRMLPAGDRTDIGRWEDAEFIAAARTDIPALVAALNAVLRLHGADSYGDCCECGNVERPHNVPWPCLTVLDIRAALNGEATR